MSNFLFYYLFSGGNKLPLEVSECMFYTSVDLTFVVGQVHFRHKPLA